MIMFYAWVLGRRMKGCYDASHVRRLRSWLFTKMLFFARANYVTTLVHDL